MDPPDDSGQSQPEFDHDAPSIPCDSCRSALRDGGRRDPSFLLLDQLTVPLVSCEKHLEQFADVCELTTENTADLLQHRPAGGIRCPGCRLAPQHPAQPMVPVGDGAIAVVACPEHQTELVSRFQTGLQTRQDLTSELGADSPSSL